MKRFSGTTVNFALVLILTSWLAVGAEGTKKYDFEFKDMDLKKILISIARLQGKNLIFSKGVEAKSVELSLAHVTAEEAMSLLLDNYGLIVEKRGQVLHVLSAAERAPAETRTHLLTLSHALARELEPNIKSFLGSAGSVSVNESRNALIVTASEENMKRVSDLVSELDQSSHQIMIEAKIVETSTNFSRSLGLQWGSNLDNRNANGVSLDASVTGNALQATITNFSVLQARLMAGEQNGDLKIISNPKIATLNGIPATIESGTIFTIRTLAAIGVVPGQSGSVSGASTTTGSDSFSGTGTSGTVGGLQRVKSGVRLKVTPYIVNQGQVRLQIALSKSDPDFSQKIDGIPGITDNSAETSLIVKSGETASIGGLMQKSNSTNLNGTPILSKIPLLGWLFGSHEDGKRDHELVIFLTPTISIEEVSARVPDSLRKSEIRFESPSGSAPRKSSSWLAPKGKTETSSSLAMPAPMMPLAPPVLKAVVDPE